MVEDDDDLQCRPRGGGDEGARDEVSRTALFSPFIPISPSTPLTTENSRGYDIQLDEIALYRLLNLHP